MVLADSSQILATLSETVPADVAPRSMACPPSVLNLLAPEILASLAISRNTVLSQILVVDTAFLELVPALAKEDDPLLNQMLTEFPRATPWLNDGQEKPVSESQPNDSRMLLFSSRFCSFNSLHPTKSDLRSASPSGCQISRKLFWPKTPKLSHMWECFSRRTSPSPTELQPWLPSLSPPPPGGTLFIIMPSNLPVVKSPLPPTPPPSN